MDGIRRKWLPSGVALAWLALALLAGYLIGMAHTMAIEGGGKRESFAIGLAIVAQDNAAADVYAGTADPIAGHAFVKGTYVTPYATIGLYLAGALVAFGLVAAAAIRRERLAGQLLFMAFAGYLSGMAHGTLRAEIPLWDAGPTASGATPSGVGESHPVDRDDAAVAR